MRIAIGGFFHESNTFVARRTTVEDYASTRLYAGEEMVGALRGTDTEVGGFLAAAEELGFEAVPTFYAWAWPAGPLTAACFRSLLDRLVAAMEAAQPVDGVLLTIHGAMVAEGEDDPDGLILAETRGALGPGVPLVATFDLHANLSPLMVSSCSALLGYRTYPHVDLADTGREAARLLVRMLREEAQPVMALAKPPLMPHIVRQRTEDGPMAAMMALAREAERRLGVLRVSVAAGFAYADVPRMGMGVLAVTDGDGELASEVAHDLADEAWRRRREFDAQLPRAPAAVRRALASPRAEGTRPVVLADLADNVGGGSPGDGTEILAALLEAYGSVGKMGSLESLGGLGSLAHRDSPSGTSHTSHTPHTAHTSLTGSALVLLCDPESVHAAIAAGVREQVRLRVGGKTDRMHGEPVAVEGRVRLIADGVFRNRGPMRDGLVDDQGRTAVVECGPLLLVLTERRMPMWNLEQLRSLGIEPSRLGIIVVKGAVAHRAAYGPVAAEMIEVDTAGACAGDVRRFEYHQIRRPLYPLDDW